MAGRGQGLVLNGAEFLLGKLEGPGGGDRALRQETGKSLSFWVGGAQAALPPRPQPLLLYCETRSCSAARLVWNCEPPTPASHLSLPDSWMTGLAS